MSKKATELKKKLLAKSNIKGASFIDESIYFGQIDFVPTKLLALNVILSGFLGGGVSPGTTTIAGESRTFKTLFGLLMMKAYMTHYPDSVVLFYDSEFGAKPAYLKNFGIDVERVLHIPIMNIEELKFDLMGHLEQIKDEKIFIFVDSIGNLASKKEMDDAIEGKSVEDMTRARKIKSLGRMITPYLSFKKIPMVMIGHTYKTMDFFPQDVVSGGSGIVYISDNILLVKKKKVKEGTVKTGNIFNVIAYKSRFVREEAKVGIQVDFNKKLSPYTGLFDMAVDLGYIKQPKKGWYSRVFDATGEDDKMHRRKDVEYDGEFWVQLCEKSKFEDAIKEYYALEQIDMLDDEEENSK